ncbi:SPL family radical SAM protein [Oribacterium sp. WCC10]|uniref:SPL family radical SAM protein n=1 Tax=Oribacterium sp. WCC10 TaxID=1855343 RepID=UPI0008E53BDA|nr:DNA repair photolyase [Oribacterium sp. WCC10]SFG15151.1 spore photoproduct lyase [Oribacterium sp. WCC10]
MQSETVFRNKAFSHIYVEDRILNIEQYRGRAEEILKHFPEAEVVAIDHYKDVFNRHKQNYVMQHESQALILALKQGNFVYPGAEVCQNMGNKHFYYASCMMNCLFDCEYCYLKGMYPSGNMVIFLNLEDIFTEVLGLLEKHPVYLCVSYDTDLMAVESLTGYVKKWIEFTSAHPELIIEIRTKAGNVDFRNLLPVYKDGMTDGGGRVIFAFTLSPEYVVSHYEHRTGSLENRIRAVKQALELGFTVRLCFDPMIYCPDWRKEYGSMLERVFSEIQMDRVYDLSVGSFRLSEEYLKAMRRNMPDSAVVQYPYQNDHGVYHYSEKLTDEMEKWLVSRLAEKVPVDRIFRWQDQDRG